MVFDAIYRHLQKENDTRKRSEGWVIAKEGLGLSNPPCVSRGVAAATLVFTPWRGVSAYKQRWLHVD